MKQSSTQSTPGNSQNAALSTGLNTRDTNVTRCWLYNKIGHRAVQCKIAKLTSAHFKKDMVQMRNLMVLAFDSVSHQKLLTKLEGYGICGHHHHHHSFIANKA